MKRRQFTQTLLTTLTGYALLDTLFAYEAFARPVKPLADHWAKELQTYCADLKKNHLSLVEWQSHVEALYQRIDLQDLMRFIDLERLTQNFAYPDLGVETRPVKFPVLSGLPEKTAFIKKVFGMEKDRAIIPHGHSNMVSAHLVLKGDMHLRNYEKLELYEEHMVIRPSVDRLIRPGESSTMSDEKDNVHWFIADTAEAFTFDVIVLDLQGQSYDIHNLDIYEQTSLGDGTLRVPVLDVQTALKKYGKETHH